MSIVDTQAQLATEVCPTCGTLFAVLKDVQDRRRNDHKSFFCPFGHQQSYSGKTETDKLREQLDAKQREAQANLERAWLAEGAERRVSARLKRTEKRIRNGVCPCCNRSFANLAAHMKTQHPKEGK